MGDVDNSEGLVLSPLACKSCGGELWVKPKLDGKPSLAKKHCDSCRKELQRECQRKYEKNRPRRLERYSKRREKYHRRKIRKHCPCCLTYFDTKRKRTTYCSKACAGNAQWAGKRKADQPKYSKVQFLLCKACGNVFSNRRSKLVCSTKCATVYYRRIQVAENAKSMRCCICDIEYSPLYGYDNNKTCSDQCKKELKRRNKRAARAVRKARMRACGDAASFDPYKVFNRDDWKCQACGCDTPHWLRGTLDDNAPELDHIVPLSRGGEHSLDNTQCLCRVCNILKSNNTQEEYIQWNQGLVGV